MESVQFDAAAISYAPAVSGMAAAAIPAVSLAASGQDSAPAGEPARNLFDVRKYGATGDGKTLDTEAVNRAIEAAAATGGRSGCLPGGIVSLFFYPLEEPGSSAPGAGQRNRGLPTPDAWRPDRL